MNSFVLCCLCGTRGGLLKVVDSAAASAHFRTGSNGKGTAQLSRKSDDAERKRESKAVSLQHCGQNGNSEGLQLAVP